MTNPVDKIKLTTAGILGRQPGLSFTQNGFDYLVWQGWRDYEGKPGKLSLVQTRPAAEPQTTTITIYVGPECLESDLFARLSELAVTIITNGGGFPAIAHLFKRLEG